MWNTGQKPIIGLKANVKAALAALSAPTDPNEAAQMSAAIAIINTHVDGVATNGASVTATGMVTASGARLNFNIIPTNVVDQN
ncbi:MAG TPA: hypothetical protein VGY56_11265 [Verrucomicrobiae bacterium]|nr:hypothetical protein [Verrucomicrobiae bacterium]